MSKLIFDDENNIIDYIQSSLNSAVLFNDNSFEKKILKMLKNPKCLISKNGHENLPPDFICPKHSMMFDVMRVNDTEILENSKVFNPVKARERKMLKELDASGLSGLNPNMKIICNSESSDVNEHSFQKYRDNVSRTVFKHLSSEAYPNKIKQIWAKENPEIKYKGFLIFDETECCFDGIIKYFYDNKFAFFAKRPMTLHEPWNDKDFIQWAYDSDLDFVVWACTYKPYGTIPLRFHINFPPIVIIDVRYPRTTKYLDYSNKNLVL